MTAICLYCSPEEVTIAADGATYDELGRLMGPVTKVFPIPHLNGVIANTGLGGMATAVLNDIGGRFANFDEFVAGAEQVMREAYSRLTHRLLDPPRSTMVFAGWLTAKASFATFKMHSSEREVFAPDGSGRIELAPAWTAIPIDGLWASNTPSQQAMEECGINQPNSAIDFTARMVCASRRESGVDNGDGVFGVGCFLQITLLTRDRSVTWIAHRWPDEIGKPIDPNVGERMPTFPIVL